MTPTAVVLISFLLLAIMNGSIKKVRETLPAIEVAYFRCFFAFMIVSCCLGWHQVKRTFGDSLGLWRRHSLRSVLAVLAVFCYVQAAPYLPLAEATALGFTNPLILACLARLLLKERIPPIRWFAIALGFVGVLLVVQPTGATGRIWAAIVLLTACIFAASGDIVMKTLVRKQTTSQVALMLFALTTLLFLPFLPFVWRTPTSGEWLLLAVVGIAGGLFQLAFTKAFQLMPASLVAPYSYTSLVWAFLFGSFFWGELPNWQGILGTLFIIADGVLAYISARYAAPAAQAQTDGSGKREMVDVA